MSTRFVQMKEATLQSSISSSATEAVFTEFVDLAGVPVVQTNFGDVGYGTLEPNTAREEAVSFLVTSNPSGTATLTLTRGLRGKHPYGAGGVAFAHNAGSKLVISNNPDLLNKLTAKDNDEVIEGSWQFTAPVADANPATKGYTDTQDAAVAALVATEAGIRSAADTALDSAMVKITGNQTVAGVKTFSSPPIIPPATNPSEAVNRSQMEFYIAANSGNIKASDTAFGTVKLNKAPSDPQEPIAIGVNEPINQSEKSLDPSQDVDKLVKLEETGQFHPDFIPSRLINSKLYTVAENMNGSVTPVAVCVNENGHVQLAQANLTNRDRFIGFCSANINNAQPAFVNGGQQAFGTGAPGTLSFAAGAGVDRVVLVHIAVLHSGAPTNPTSVTYNGQPMTLINARISTNNGSTTWAIAIGSNVAADAPVNIVQTGASSVSLSVVQAVCYQFVNQATPIRSASAATGSSTTAASALNPEQGLSMVLNFLSATNSNLGSFGQGQSTRLSGTNPVAQAADSVNRTSENVSYSATFPLPVNWAFHSIELNSSQAASAQIALMGTIPFPSLTPNSRYFLSNTAGQISTTPGATSVLLGKATATNELLIIQS